MTLSIFYRGVSYGEVIGKNVAYLKCPGTKRLHIAPRPHRRIRAARTLYPASLSNTASPAADVLNSLLGIIFVRIGGAQEAIGRG
jgi:hypothetical protein